MLDPTVASRVAATFGVSAEQVRRDHLVSHVLAILSGELVDEVLFFGGTALARTHLPAGRLSEDVDLVARTSRQAVAAVLEPAVARGLRREFGRVSWSPPLTAVRGATAGVLQTADGLAVRVQLLDPKGLPPWPAELRDLEQRYPDAPAARLWVPTRPALVAAKTAAWFDRASPRDLWDLWSLAALGAIDDEALRLFTAYGPMGRPPPSWLFDRVPTAASWQRELGGQTRLTVTPLAATEAVRLAWQAAVRGAAPRA